MKKNCFVCKREFETKWSFHVYCSLKCRNKRKQFFRNKLYICKHCKKEFFHYKVGMKFCSKKCSDLFWVGKQRSPKARERLRISALKNKQIWEKGHIPWNKGIPNSEETNKKLRLRKLPRGYKRPLEVREKLSGENCHFWRGGITPLHTEIRHLPESKTWTQKVFKRDDYCCNNCGIRGGRLNSHHIKPFKIIFKEFLQTYSQFSPIEDKDTLLRLALTYEPFWDTNNGLTLCKTCHRKDICVNLQKVV